MRKNQKYTQEDMFAAIEHCQKHGITPKEYCKEHEIPYPSFQYWLRKYRSQRLNENIKSGKDFLPVQIKEGSPTTGSELIITYPNGTQVSCPFSIPAQLLHALIIS